MSFSKGSMLVHSGDHVLVDAALKKEKFVCPFFVIFFNTDNLFYDVYRFLLRRLKFL